MAINEWERNWRKKKCENEKKSEHTIQKQRVKSLQFLSAIQLWQFFLSLSSHPIFVSSVFSALQNFYFSCKTLFIFLLFRQLIFAGLCVCESVHIAKHFSVEYLLSSKKPSLSPFPSLIRLMWHAQFILKKHFLDWIWNCVPQNIRTDHHSNFAFLQDYRFFFNRSRQAHFLQFQ